MGEHLLCAKPMHSRRKKYTKKGNKRSIKREWGLLINLRGA